MVAEAARPTAAVSLERVLLAQLSGSLNLLFLQFTFMSLSVANGLGNSGNLFTSWPIIFLVSVTY